MFTSVNNIPSDRATFVNKQAFSHTLAQSSIVYTLFLPSPGGKLRVVQPFPFLLQPLFSCIHTVYFLQYVFNSEYCLLVALHQDVSYALGGQTASECSGPQDGQRQTAGEEHALREVDISSHHFKQAKMFTVCKLFNRGDLS